jgi:hypothetical protein
MRQTPGSGAEPRRVLSTEGTFPNISRSRISETSGFSVPHIRSRPCAVASRASVMMSPAGLPAEPIWNND